MKILLSLPDYMVHSIDEFCRREEMTRSGYIRNILRERLGPPIIQRASEMKVPVLSKVATAPPQKKGFEYADDIILPSRK